MTVCNVSIKKKISFVKNNLKVAHVVNIKLGFMD